jgi:hypothetical protein
VTSHRVYSDPDSLACLNPIKNTDNPDNDCSDDYSTQLSDVFIDFSSDFRDNFLTTTDEVDNPEAIIENC